MGAVSDKLRKSAKGQDCTFRIPGVCNGNPETTVFCHGPSEAKGMGNKGHDWFGAFGCSSCHEAVDNFRVDGLAELWLRGIERTQEIWVGMGLMVVPLTIPRERKVEKVATAQKPSKRSFQQGRKMQSGNSFKRQEART